MTCQCCCGDCDSPCCGTPSPVTGGQCCDGVWETGTGTCCDGVWYEGLGTCCGGVWYPAGTSGECCGGEWHTGEGYCCDGTWYVAPEGESAPSPPGPFVWPSAQCPEGHVFASYGNSFFGEFRGCCGCIPEEVFDPRAGGPSSPGEMVPVESVVSFLCCDLCAIAEPYLPFNSEGTYLGCFGRCCEDGECSRTLFLQCGGLWDRGCCGEAPDPFCVTECCHNGDAIEEATFAVTGEVVTGAIWTLTFGELTFSAEALGYAPYNTLSGIAILLATAAYTPFGQFSATASGETVTVIGPLAGSGTITPPGGSPQGPISSSVAQVPVERCSLLIFPELERVPRVDGACPCKAGQQCCESVTSTASGLAFTKPVVFPGTVRVTVTGTTDSPILIHGKRFGLVGKRCPFSHTFLLCWGSFNIEPLPCDTDFIRLVATVCWEEAYVNEETLDFSGCSDISVWLSHCSYGGCITTLRYSGAGATSSAPISMYGDAVIEASGSGALVLTGNITPASSGCIETLTLTGTNTDENTISGVIGNSPAPLRVDKTGAGTWKLTGQSAYAGRLRVLNGTLIVGSVATGGNNSPFGSSSGTAGLPVIGDAAASSGTAALLTTGTVNRGFYVAGGGGSQVVVLGSAGAGLARFEGGRLIRLGRSVTLQASTGGTVAFANEWVDPDDGPLPVVGFTIGTAGNEGTVVLENYLPESATGVNVSYGTLQLSYEDPVGGTLWETVPLTLGDTVVVVIKDVGQRLSTITFSSDDSEISGSGGGTLWLVLGVASPQQAPHDPIPPTVTVDGTGNEISCPVVLDDDVAFLGEGGLLVSGVMSGAFGVVMDGTGTVSLSGNNTYSGTTTINSGTMKAESLTAFGTGDIVVEANGTLDKNGYALANNIVNNGGTIIP